VGDAPIYSMSHAGTCHGGSIDLAEVFYVPSLARSGGVGVARLQYDTLVIMYTT
jgi:hypothetical protein